VCENESARESAGARVREPATQLTSSAERQEREPRLYWHEIFFQRPVLMWRKRKPHCACARSTVDCERARGGGECTSS
jgi:hypothetical protein